MKYLAALVFVMLGVVTSVAQVQLTVTNKTPYPLQNVTVGTTTTALIRPGQHVTLSLPSVQLLDNSPCLEATATAFDTSLHTIPVKTSGVVNLQTVFTGNFTYELRLGQDAYGNEVLLLLHTNKPGYCGTVGTRKVVTN